MPTSDQQNSLVSRTSLKPPPMVGLPKLLPLTVALSLGLPGCGGGGDGGGGGVTPDPPRATSITISPQTLAMTFLGEVTRLTASVRDQNGQPFNTTVTWSGGDPNVATVSGSGDVTATGNGTATVNASAGSVSSSATVTVQQVATQATIISGDGQAGTVGEALGSELVAQSGDAGGAAVGNVGLSFQVTSGGGTLSAMSVTTDADGLGSSAWTLGTGAGTQTVAVSITGVSASSATFSVEAAPGPAVAFVLESGDAQSGPRGFALPQPVGVKLADEFGNGVEEGPVAFAVTGGGGTVDPTSVATGADGLAQAAWTLGPVEGPNTMTVTAEGFDAVAFTATALGVSNLTVDVPTTSPVFPTPADAVTVSAVVTNIGDGPTGLGFPVRILVDGGEVTRTTVSALAAGAAFTVSLPVGPFPDGTYLVTVEPIRKTS